jgi:hypothetical protein
MFDVRRTSIRAIQVCALVVLTVFASPYEVGSSSATPQGLFRGLLRSRK